MNKKLRYCDLSATIKRCTLCLRTQRRKCPPPPGKVRKSFTKPGTFVLSLKEQIRVYEKMGVGSGERENV